MRICGMDCINFRNQAQSNTRAFIIGKLLEIIRKKEQKNFTVHRKTVIHQNWFEDSISPV